MTETDTKPKAETKQETGPKPSSSEKPESPAETKKATSFLKIDADVIKEIKHPLSFFAAALLVAEVILYGTFSAAAGVDKTITVIGMISVIFFLVFCVLFLAVFRPRSLYGEPEKTRAVGSKTLGEILGDPETYKLLTEHYINNQNWAKAKQCCDGALKLNPESILANYDMGRIHHGKMEYNKAIASYEKVLKINEKDPYAWKGLGDAYATQFKYDKAVEMYKKALKIEPQDEDGWIKLGSAYERLGNSVEAKKCYSKAKTYAHP